MMTVKTAVKKSSIHGLGAFADEAIPAGRLVWRFTPPVDEIVDRATAPKEILDRGYVNPRNPNELVICGDNAQFINFNSGRGANLLEIKTPGESDLVAGRNIEFGEELTVDSSTDADFARKMETSL